MSGDTAHSEALIKKKAKAGEHLGASCRGKRESKRETKELAFSRQTGNSKGAKEWEKMDGMTRPRKKTQVPMPSRPLHPKPKESSFSWPWWIDCASPSCPLPRKSQDPETQKDAESRTRNGNGTRSLASPRARLSLTGPRPATRPSTVSVSRLQCRIGKPWPNRVRQPRPNITTPRAWNSGASTHFADGPTNAAPYRGGGQTLDTSCSKPSAHQKSSSIGACLLPPVEKKHHSSIISTAFAPELAKSAPYQCLRCRRTNPTNHVPDPREAQGKAAFYDGANAACRRVS